MRSRPVLTSCAIALLVLSACGDDGGTTTTGRATSGTETTDTAGTEATDDTAPAGGADDEGAAPADSGPRPSVGCEADGDVEAGRERLELTSGGVDWWYLRHVPPAHDGDTPLPLVVDFHGYSEGAEIHVQHSALDVFGDEHGFVSVFPQGQGEVAFWNSDLAAPDVEFFADMLDELEADLCLDLDRLHVTGLSNGAFMTSAVACAHADRIASVAPVAGIRDIDGCDPSRPVPVVAFHGTDDGFVSYDGGLGADAANLPAPDGSGQSLGESGLAESSIGEASIPEITQAWAERNGCEPEPDEEEVADDVTLVSFDCPDGATTELYRVEEGGHSWPGSEFSAVIEDIVGPTTMSIWANEIMWEFFEDHPLPRS
jgi:polyhydroxybutyrate depolymerase